MNVPADDVIGTDAEILVDLSLDPQVGLVGARCADVVVQKLQLLWLEPALERSKRGYCGVEIRVENKVGLLCDSVVTPCLQCGRIRHAVVEDAKANP